MNIIAKTLEALQKGGESSHGSLAMLPLLAPPNEAGYITLDEALASGFLEIGEVSQGGSVPELRAANKSDAQVLLLDGEELIGAKQNRVLNLTILMAARTTLTIPVSCVEAGRWSHVSKHFSAASRAQFARGRAHKQRDVTASLRERGERRSQQGRVWSDIAEMAVKMQAPSATGAMSAIYERHAGSLDGFVTALHPIDGQVGAVFAIAGEVIGMDLFDSQRTLARTLPKLVRSYAVEAIGLEATTKLLAGADFLAELSRAPAAAFPALGLGKDLRIAGESITGAALVDGGRVVHLSAFRLQPEHGEAGRPESRMARPSQRIRRRPDVESPPSRDR